MSVISTSSTRFSAVVKYELEPSLAVCRDAIVINDAAQTLSVGAVLGKVTATGKYKLCTSGAADGSQTPAAILLMDGNGNSGDMALAANTDTNAVALTRGPALVADSALQLGSGITISAVKSALAGVGIQVETAL